VGYTLDAFVYPLTNWWPAHLPAYPRVMLSEAPPLVMIPLVDPVYEQITGDNEESVDYFSRLTEPLRRFGRELSAGGPVLYICGDGSAGGTQESIGWRDGYVCFGPAQPGRVDIERSQIRRSGRRVNGRVDAGCCFSHAAGDGAQVERLSGRIEIDTVQRLRGLRGHSRESC